MYNIKALLPYRPAWYLLLLHLIFCSVFFTHWAYAELEFELEELAPGEIVLNFSVNEQTSARLDIMHFNLSYSSEGESPEEIQQDVNTVMNSVIPILEGRDTLSYSIDNYQVWRIPSRGRDEPDQSPIWRAQQSLHIQSTDFSQLLLTVEDLQNEGLIINGQYYSLSDEARQRITAILLETALQNIETQAMHTAELLGKKDAILVEVSLQNMGVPMPMARVMMADAAMNEAISMPPAAAAGETTVNLSIQAVAILKP